MCHTFLLYCEQIVQDAIATKSSRCSAFDLSTVDKAKLSTVEARLKEVSGVRV